MLLDPAGKLSLKDDDDINTRQQDLQKAFNDFYTLEEETRLLRRNRVQNRIIAASNQRCSEFKKFVKQFDSSTNLFLGGLTTLTAGLGSIFTAANTVRALSGTAAITSGFRAEVNDAYFQQQTVQLLTNGLESSRKELFEEISKKSKWSIEMYTVEQAVGDAVRYHDQCSLLAGLERVALDRKRADNPSLPQIDKVLERLRGTRSKMSRLVSGSSDVLVIFSSDTENIASNAAMLPLVAFLKADKANSELSRKFEELEMAVLLNLPSAPLNPGEKPVETATESEKTDYRNNVALKIAYEKLDSDYTEGSAIVAAQKQKLINDSKTLIMKFIKDLTPEKKAEISALQNNIIEKVAEVEIEEPGTGRYVILAEINFKKAQAVDKIRVLQVATEELKRQSSKAGKVLDIVSRLNTRIKAFKKDPTSASGGAAVAPAPTTAVIEEPLE